MGDVVQNADREFWRAPVVPVVETSANIAEACTGCGTEFIMGAGFCHVCGADRHKVASALVANCSWTRLFEFHHIQAQVGLPTLSLIAFLVGGACTLAALLVGFVFSVNTLLDWQAVQVWRIEWLLSAAVAFLAGILLKNQN
jgi:hypothetical protein